MPANIRVTVDSASANMQLGANTATLNQQDKQADSVMTKIKNNWALISQIATLSLSQLARATEGTAVGAAVQAAQTGLQIAQTEIAIYRLGVQAAAAALDPLTWGQAAGYTVLAGMLQGTMIANMITQSQQQANQRNAEELARQLESYI